MGLVEVGVGLLPGGGGCMRWSAAGHWMTASALRPGARGESVELMCNAMKKTFETIATAKVSSSAAGGAQSGNSAQGDGVTMNRERVLTDTKATALRLARAGYVAPQPRTRSLRQPRMYWLR